MSKLDRRIIFALVALALSLPLIFEYSLTPARMNSADKAFKIVSELSVDEGQIAFLAFDFGPNTQAENLPQAEVMVEHLMRRRIPFVVYSLYVLAEPLLASIPEKVAARLAKEMPGEIWAYGKDWVNLGYKPGGFLIVQAIPKSENLIDLFKTDARGNNLSDLPALKGVKGLESIKLLAEFTGLVGMFDTYVQFFQRKDYRPLFIHGCTSITIPEAYIYMDSGQLNGLFEGIAGAAWYSELLKRQHHDRAKDSSELINTGLGVAHLVIIAMVLLGNFVALVRILRSGQHA